MNLALTKVSDEELVRRIDLSKYQLFPDADSILAMSLATPTIAPPKRKKSPKISPDDGSGPILGWDSQVVLFNDDVNTFEHVIDSLMAVFGREQQPARFCAE